MDSLLISNLKHHLKLIAGNTHFSEAIEYALLPPGKLFRPKLAINLSLDLLPDIFINEELIERSLHNPLSGLSLICSFLEFHHTYTLIHDDLPCMDDDDFRRGKPSLHKKFNESTAVLAGDALILGSLELLGKIDSLKASDLSLICKMLGSRGLIFGQVLDMDANPSQSIERTLQVHYLKTAKLLQASLLLPLLAYRRSRFSTFIKLYRIGKDLGILFQLLDDLAEIGEGTITEHEKLINPWLNQTELCFKKFEQIFCRLSKKLSELSHTRKFCREYLVQSKNKLEHNKIKFKENSIILKIDKLDLKPVMALLDTF
jgi:geranylgeranyl pyrophosphate synthase